MINIRYLENEEKINIRPLYEKTFDDSKEFVDYYFDGPVYDNDVLVLENEGEILSKLQLIPKRMVYQGDICLVHYIYAVATDENHRHCGYMEKLLERAFDDLTKKGEPFTYLVPVNPAVYKKFGFRVAYLKPKYKFKQEPCQMKVYHPNKMDSVILTGLSRQILTSGYDTYLVHDEAYFDQLFTMLELEKGYLIYHMEGEKLTGYTLVTADGEIFESLFRIQPPEIVPTGYTPWVMVKNLREDCRVGRMCINDET